MKKTKIFSVIIILALITFSFITKTKIKDTTSNPDSIGFIQFDLCPYGIGYSLENTALLSQSKFLTKFGNPIKQTRQYSKFNNAYSYNFVYKGAEAWFKNDTLKSLIFTNSNYKFIFSNGITIKVGDSISSVSKLFANSWNDRKTTLKNQIYVGLLNSSGPLDAGLVFEFKPSSGLITTIAIFK